MPESQLRQRIRAALRFTFPGALVLGWPANQWTGAGWPDLLFSDWPLLVGFEVKYGRRSKPTPVQGARHSLLRAHHIPVYVVHTPSEAVDTITLLKERLPMAFDPNLLAELEAALNGAPTEQPAPTIQDEATADQNAADLANGTAVFEEITLDADLPAPDIEDITSAIVAEGTIARIQADEALEIERTLLGVLLALKDSVDALSINVAALLEEVRGDKDADVPQTAEAPAPRRRRTRQS